MSKDIRSFFQLKKPVKPKVEDDEDVIPESPNVQVQKKKKESRKKRVLNDSDDEIFTTKKKKTEDLTKSKEKSKAPQKPALKEVKASDIFGSAPLKRTEPFVKRVKKTETGIHSDDEFDKSLLEVDESLLIEADEVKASKLDVNIHKDNKSDNHKSPKDKEKSSKDKSSKNHESKAENAVKRENIDKAATIEKKSKFSEFVDDGAASIKISEQHVNGQNESNTETVEKQDNKRKLKHDDTLDSTLVNNEPDNKKKKKLNKSMNESVLTDEERHERKMHSAALYKNYLNRSGPKHLGTKQIPEGSPDCLKDTAFLLTGVLDSFERDEVTEAIVKYGGCVKNGISRKVTHVLAGDEAGPAKLAKAQELGIKVLSEDEFLQLITDRSQNKAKKKEKSPNRKSNSEKKESHKHKNESSHNEVKVEKHKESDSLNKVKKSNHEKKLKSPKEIKKEKKLSSETDVDKITVKSRSESNIKKVDEKADVKSETVPKSHSLNDLKNNTVLSSTNSIMWVDKYKPQNIKQIIGQHGDSSNVKKLSNWLTKWYMNRKAKLPKPSPWAKNDDGGYFKAALLSGPPGVGKTTTVSLVCKELGFDMVEFNASDTRNKTLIKEQIGELLSTTSLSGYAKGDTGKQAITKKHVLVMDEVDGMAGNEDRGGLQELISLIKSTSVPIICMCNDRNSQKMRSFVNYCYDLRFSRPKVEQIKSAMLSICFKEGFKIPPDVLTQVIVAANQDVRLTLHLLSMWAVDPGLSDADHLRRDAKNIKKDIKLGPWEAVRKVFSAEEHKTMSINDKSDLFFYDYSLSPLFVQENYLMVAPHCDKKEVLSRISRAAESISAGNLIDSRIRSNQAWSLLPMQAMYSSVIPGAAMSGHVTGQIQFPGWLGKNSRASKMQRLCQQIHAHTRLSTSGSKSSIFLDYCTHLRDAIVTPLIKDKTEGIDKSLEVLEAYHLLREDLDSLTELSLWPGQRNPTVLIDSKVKAAMTRTYNKKASALPYAPGAIKRARTNDEPDDEEDPDEVEQEDSDPENDALIKKKKKAVKSDDAKATSSKASGKDKSKKKK